MQSIDAPNEFVLVEVYKNEEAPAAHKETAHYQIWRDEVADWMDKPRSAMKFNNIFPSENAGWECE